MSNLIPTLNRPTYRWLDRLTKLSGVLLIAAGTDAGIASGTGIALAVAGVILGLSTVPIDTQELSTVTGGSNATDGGLK